MNKGELMRLVYSQEELRNIDSGLPKEYWDGKNKDIQLDDTYFYVMNYNDNRYGGNLEDMRVIAKQRGIILTQE